MGNDTRPATLGDMKGVHERLDCVIKKLAEGATQTAALTVEVRGLKTETARTRVTLFGREGNGGSPGVLRDLDATKGRVATLEKTRRRQVKAFWVVVVGFVTVAMKQTWEWVRG